MSPHLTDRENQQLEEHYSIVIRCYFAERYVTAVHAAVRHDGDYDVNPEAVLKLVKLSLKLGADPNVFD